MFELLYYLLIKIIFFSLALNIGFAILLIVVVLRWLRKNRSMDSPTYVANANYDEEACVTNDHLYELRELNET